MARAQDASALDGVKGNADIENLNLVQYRCAQRLIKFGQNWIIACFKWACPDQARVFDSRQI